MGNTDEEEEFGEPDYARFRGRLEECLAALGQLLEQPGLGTGPVTMGTEAELFLVDGSARPRGDPGPAGLGLQDLGHRPSPGPGQRPKVPCIRVTVLLTSRSSSPTLELSGAMAGDETDDGKPA
jgi:hypothetical protein